MSRKKSASRPHRTMTPKQRADARASARRHGRSRPGLWENVNASKGKGAKAMKARKARRTRKGKTRPGKRSRRARKRG